ncbi:MAG: enoyl-CoA hydratase/isomerase family protein [Rhizobiaceae bacterium]|nr:enoyl-CoA hydratase/isomerase family protein [Rhizobiaceae bacterium]
MTGDGVDLVVEDAVATITIRREARRNALGHRHFADLVRLLDCADRDDAVAVIVLTGAGDRAFCAGADISAGEAFFKNIGERQTTGLGDFLRRAHRLTKPLVGRINGHCYAGGVGLLAACDIAIAADDARFALPEIRLGLFPFVVLAGLRGKVAASFATELAVTGVPVSAERAALMGLINESVSRSDLDAAVGALAGTIATQPRRAMQSGLASLRPLDAAAFEAAIAQAEEQTLRLAAARS